MNKILSWKEIQKKYPNMWVAISDFSDDEEVFTNSKGTIYAFAKTEDELAGILKEKEDIPLAIEYTGPRLIDNFHGGIWVQKNI